MEVWIIPSWNHLHMKTWPPSCDQWNKVAGNCCWWHLYEYIPLPCTGKLCPQPHGVEHLLVTDIVGCTRP